MKRVIAMLLCSIVAAFGLVAAAPASEATLPPLPITITCTGAGCVGSGQIGPILVKTQRFGQGVIAIVCVSHIPGNCDLASGILVFGSNGLTAITGTAGIPTGAFFTINRYVVGGIVVVGGGYLVEAAVNQLGAALVAFTPFLRKCVFVTGGQILTPPC